MIVEIPAGESVDLYTKTGISRGSAIVVTNVGQNIVTLSDSFGGRFPCVYGGFSCISSTGDDALHAVCTTGGAVDVKQTSQKSPVVGGWSYMMSAGSGSAGGGGMTEEGVQEAVETAIDALKGGNLDASFDTLVKMQSAIKSRPTTSVVNSSVATAVEGLATSAYVDSAVDGLASPADITSAVNALKGGSLDSAYNTILKIQNQIKELKTVVDGIGGSEPEAVDVSDITANIDELKAAVDELPNFDLIETRIKTLEMFMSSMGAKDDE